MIVINRKHAFTRSGFTLIELLVVIAIIALMSAVIFASLSTARAKARDANRIATAKSLKTALALYEDKYGTVIGINGLSASASGTAILVASGTNSIADVLVNEGFLSRKIAGDTVFGTSEYFLGVASDGKYDVYAKLERPESAMSSTTLSNGSDGSAAVTAGYNYASGFGSGVGQAGGGVVASGGGGGGGGPAGGVAYVSPGSYVWTVPAGVSSVSVVAIGGASAGAGAGLTYKNNIPVTPGAKIAVTVGLGGSSGLASVFNATTTILDTKSGGTLPTGGDANFRGGPSDGGGAAGYTENGYGQSAEVGGNAGNYTQSGGVGGVGYEHPGCTAIGGGGGQSIYGLNGGPKGTNGGVNSGYTGGNGGKYGGAGSSGCGSSYASPGGGGAVRIIWPGDTRLFPSTGMASTSETQI
jgi:prepilin-type N-terminal cleavage/methylation domain-containing protein